MKSPFPGMDPYLELHWLDVHSRLMIYACDQLQAALPSDLRARVQERVFIQPKEYVATFFPDLRVTERKQAPSRRPARKGTLAVAEPVVIHLDEEEEPATETFLEIVDAGSRQRVVTVIEALSSSNKWPGKGRTPYRRKQHQLKKARVSLVEIDLLRAGQRVLAVPLDRIPPTHRTTYQVSVRRGWQPQDIEVYPVPLRERLPVIGIPLRQSDADVPLDLQGLIDQCYQRGRYDDVDYTTETDRLLRKARRR
jgi:hypothetical protein